jgi:hypothetical protein
MYKYFTANETHKWIDIVKREQSSILQDLVNSYNNSFHSRIAMKPVDASRCQMPEKKLGSCLV